MERGDPRVAGRMEANDLLGTTSQQSAARISFAFLETETGNQNNNNDGNKNKNTDKKITNKKKY